MAASGAKDLIGLINRDNNLTFTEDTVRFEEPVDLPNGRTRVVTYAPRGSGYKGYVTVKYQRIGLQTLFKCFIPKVDLTPFIDNPIDELLGQIYVKYGVRLDPAELNVTELDKEDGIYYTLTTNDASLHYSGYMDVKATYIPLEISDVVGNAVDDYQYPTDKLTTLFARVYSGGFYVPELVNELALYQVNQQVGSNIGWLAQTLSGDTWYHDGLVRREFNSYAGTVTYNGLIKDWGDFHPSTGKTLLTPPSSATNVLVVSLNSYLCSGLNGSVTFYY